MTDLTLALVVFLFPLAYSPGPGNLFFAATGARFGLAATLPASTGYHVATWIVTLAVGFGFAAASKVAPGAFAVLRWAGAAYVLWLAWGFTRAGAMADAIDGRGVGFGTGVFLLLLNPKAYVIIALMFSQFLSVGQGAGQILWITTVFTLNNLLAFSLWTLMGDRLAARFRDDLAARRLNMMFGLLLAGVAMWMATV
ncbi:MAG: LysE family translocator [Albidovulum sp.]|uniref:LysE family translocator n=1 Tax=Albidovulum sp. TaxID=1872424 RepID=UPI003CB31E2F